MKMNKNDIISHNSNYNFPPKKKKHSLVYHVVTSLTTFLKENKLLEYYFLWDIPLITLINNRSNLN